MNDQAGLALIALLGVVIGALLTGFFSWLGDRRRMWSEDARRWLADRRKSYASYLGLSESMLREIDGVAIFLTEGGKSIAEDDDEYIKDGLPTYQIKWEEVLQPALGEVQLLASPKVADLADRVSGALMEITYTVETRGAFDDYFPGWFQATDLVDVMRNAMRSELGIEPLGDSTLVSRRVSNWPWLEHRPDRGSYVQEPHEDGP